jgi:hypothetical protein
MLPALPGNPTYGFPGKSTGSLGDITERDHTDQAFLTIHYG